MAWKSCFAIPSDANISPQAADIIKKLICDPHERLGINGVQEIMYHPFFSGIDWKNIQKKTPPYIPDVKDEWDTKWFDKFDEKEPWQPYVDPKQ